MKKSKSIKQMIDEYALEHFGWDGKGYHCRWCNSPLTGFRGKLSIDEAKISGLCQKCQDEFFEGPEEE